MRKRSIVCMLSPALLLCLVFNTASAISSCSGNGYHSPSSSYWYQDGDPQVLRIDYINTSQHASYVRQYYKCSMCEAVGFLSTEVDYYYTNYTSHSIVSSIDLGHDSGGKPLHFRKLKCNTCSSEFTKTYSCSGPPCVSYYGIKPEMIDQ